MLIVSVNSLLRIVIYLRKKVSRWLNFMVENTCQCQKLELLARVKAVMYYGVEEIPVHPDILFKTCNIMISDIVGCK